MKTIIFSVLPKMKKDYEKSTKIIPWNKGKIVGQKKPFTRKQTRTIKEILGEKGELRDLALFSTAINTMLRESDVLSLTVGDVRDVNGEIKNQIELQQKKTGKGHIVELSSGTREILKRWITETGKLDGDYLFTGAGRYRHKPLSLRYFRDLVKKWSGLAHLDPKDYSTHSLRRSKASFIFQRTGNPEVVRQLLGQESIRTTSAYLNIGKREALKIARENEF